MKPGDFLLGVFDFFAVLLPGSLATWLALQYIPAGALQDALSFGLGGTPDPVVLGTAFLVSSYMLGHFVFMTGAHLDPSYDRWLRRAKPLSRDTTFDAAKKVRDTLSEDLHGAEFTLLKWSKVYIQITAPNARAEIDRLEADQKFFRSVVVVSAAFAAHFLLRDGAPAPGIAAIAMCALSYRRYIEQRWKMSELIYGTAAIVYGASASGAAATTNGPQ